MDGVAIDVDVPRVAGQNPELAIRLTFACESISELICKSTRDPTRDDHTVCALE